MIDKIIYTFFGWLDTFSEHLDKVFFPKPKKKKKKKCKSCHCNCHCKDELHLHHWDKDLCACEGCKC
jgi:hypothetical protein|tara:strand:- start:20115 stop:20315 length:201 start_codon:yes stop_codon:yes gene_type:complete